MANIKLEKLRREKRKNLEKIASLQERDRALDQQIKELEDIDIVGIVRAEGLTLEEFSDLMRKLRENPLPDRTEKQEEDDYDASAKE